MHPVGGKASTGGLGPLAWLAYVYRVGWRSLSGTSVPQAPQRTAQAQLPLPVVAWRFCRRQSQITVGGGLRPPWRCGGAVSHARRPAQRQDGCSWLRATAHGRRRRAARIRGVFGSPPCAGSSGVPPLSRTWRSPRRALARGFRVQVAPSGRRLAALALHHASRERRAWCDPANLASLGGWDITILARAGHTMCSGLPGSPPGRHQIRTV